MIPPRQRAMARRGLLTGVAGMPAFTLAVVRLIGLATGARLNANFR